MRRFFLALVGLGVVGTLLVASNIFQVWSAGRAHDTASVDAIVVMGAAQYDGRPTAQFKARLDHAFDLWNAGVAPIIVTTGSQALRSAWCTTTARSVRPLERAVRT